MNTIVVDYNEVEKAVESGLTTNFLFMHNFLFDKFRLIVENAFCGWTVNTIVDIRGDGLVLLHKYSVNGEIDRDTEGNPPGEFQGFFGVCIPEELYQNIIDWDSDDWWKAEEVRYAEAWEIAKTRGYCDGWFTQCDGGNYNRMEQIAQSMEYIIASLEERETKTIIKNSPKQIERKIESCVPKNRQSRVYLLSDLKRYFYINKPSVTNQIQCPCWSVRGHYRHYKNGKTIFVKSYLKGKDREIVKPKGKEYFT